MIDVDQRDAERVEVARRARPFELGEIEEMPAGERAGERVGRRQRPQLILDALLLGDVGERQHHQRLAAADQRARVQQRVEHLAGRRADLHAGGVDAAARAASVSRNRRRVSSSGAAAAAPAHHVRRPSSRTDRPPARCRSGPVRPPARSATSAPGPWPAACGSSPRSAAARSVRCRTIRSSRSRSSSARRSLAATKAPSSVMVLFTRNARTSVASPP